MCPHSGSAVLQEQPQWLIILTTTSRLRYIDMSCARSILTVLCGLSALAQDGMLVDLGTHKINIVCTGPTDARPVVIFEAGGGGTSAAWKGVQAALPPTIRACAYDRAGSGKSDSGPDPRSMDAEVTDLHALLTKADISAPVVFVGHSLGGILARLYVHKYPDSVAGVLLVDPTDEDDLVFNTKVNRWVTVGELDGALGDGARSAAKLRQTDPVPLGDRPLIVIGAGKRAEQWKQMRSARDGRVEELSRLSRNSRFIRDPISSHNVQQDNPKLVATAVQELVNRLSNMPVGQRL
jgi:pimeloyl-ACP methyl ester carboxylesterase